MHRLPEHHLTPQTHLLILTASPIGCGGLREAVSMRGGLHRVLNPFNTQTTFITFMGGASPPWSGVRGDRRHFDVAPFWRVLGALRALFSLFFALGHVLDASWALLGQFLAMFNDF